jgi:hypothetical protein
MLTGFLSASTAAELLTTMGSTVHIMAGDDCSSYCFLGGMQLYICLDLNEWISSTKILQKLSLLI